MWKRYATGLVLGALFVPAMAYADNTTNGGFEITVAGVGNSTKDVEQGQFNLEGSLGVLIGPNFELGIRQSVSYLDTDAGGQQWNGASRGFLDLQLNIGRFAPFIGGNVGYIYGDGVSDTWAGGPEAGAKFYLGQSGDVFLFGRVEYQFFFDKGDKINDVFDDGQFLYTLGVGIRA
jgi:hypothetical protein